MKNLRIAWLLTSAADYWHPMLKCLSDIHPDTQAFVANWRGFAPGYENAFKVDIVGERKVVSLRKSKASYGDNFTVMPLNIVNRLLKFKPDVIFCNSFGVWTILALLSKPIGKWRVVIAYEGSSPGVDYRNSNLRLSIRKAMVRAADACITNSHAGKEYLEEFLAATPQLVHLHPYEVPSGNALQASSAEEDLSHLEYKQPIFVFVGSISVRKGISLLLKACALLVQKGCQPFTVMIVGDGDQRQGLEDYCHAQGLEDYVKWVGKVDYQKLGAYFDYSDIFVLPTLEDTWGMVVLESMAVGKAILCSQFAGASELVKNDDNGYIFDPNDTNAFASVMKKFVDDPSLSQRMGERSSQIMAQYTPEAAAEFLASVAKDTLQ